MKTLPLLLSLLDTLTATPAIAAGASNTALIPPRDASATWHVSDESGWHLKNPWFAAALGPGSSLALMGIAGLSEDGNLLWLSPLTVGAGEFYAGDPLRGTLVSIGSYGAVALGVLAGIATYNAFPGNELQRPAATGFFTTAAGAVPILAYDAWAGWDAYHAAERANAKR